jgi:uncharacterized protein (TIGR02453 family)
MPYARSIVSSDAAVPFQGFSHDALQFLVDLAMNNERPWFQARKADYERLLKLPLEAFCDAVGTEFRAHGVPLESDARKSPFRIYRDVRFSKDKSPYKTNIAASFPWVGASGRAGSADWAGAGGYFHMAPEGTYMGGGMWHPEPGRLAAFRQAVDQEPTRTLEALEDKRFRAVFEPVHGDSLKRPPAGYAADHPHIELLKLKDVTFGRQLSDDEIFSADLPSILARDFAVAVPVMAFLASLDAGQVAG